MPRSWVVVVLVPLALWLFAGAAPWGVVPALLLLGLRWFAGRDRRLLRLGAHLEQLRWATLTAFVAPAGVMAFAYSLSNQPFVAEIEGGSFTLYVVLCALQVTGIASEFSDGTASQWLTQPRSLRSLLAERVIAATLASTAAVATLALAVPTLLTTHTFELVLGAALGGAGLIAALSTREPVAATVTSGVLLSAPLLLLAWYRDSGEVIDASMTLPLALWSLALLTTGFWQARRLLLTAQPTLPSLTSRGVGRTTPLRALARKELRLQVFTVAVGGFAMVALRLALWNSAAGAAAGMSIFFAVLLGLLCGLVAIAEEHQHGTIQSDVLAVATATVWRAKVGIAALMTLAMAGVLPMILFVDLRSGSLAAIVVAQVTIAEVCMAVGLVAASGAKQLSRSLFVGLLLVFTVLVGTGALVWVGVRSITWAFPHAVGGSPMSHAGPSVVNLALLAWAASVGLGCLIIAQRTWLTSVVPWRLVGTCAAAVGGVTLLSTIAGTLTF